MSGPKKIKKRKMNIVTEEFTKSLVGLTFEEAIDKCESINYRITREDDNNYFVTMDLRFDRINFEIDDNVVTKASIG